MGILDSVSSVVGTVNSATTAVSNAASSVSSLLDSGPASLLGSVGDSVSGAIQSVASFLAPSGVSKLPVPNPLFAYASYNYILSISVLTTDEVNNPDKSYIAGKVVPLICASANISPSNRINTPYGKFDFFIDNLILHSNIGLEKAQSTNVTTMSFDITEPYSFGMFMLSCQQAAYKAKHRNWQDAPFLLTIQFRGNKETGAMSNIPGTTRYLPFRFATIASRVTKDGTIYNCTANMWNAKALTNSYSKLKSDASVAGKTVQEVLQTGEKSLQAVINSRLKQLATDGIVKVPDEIIILFPKDVSSAGVTPAAGATEDTSSATATSQPGGASSVEKKLGVSRNKFNLLVQAESECNELGKLPMGWSESKKGDQPAGKEADIYNGKVNVRGKNKIDIQNGDMRFAQDTDVFNAINQVLLASEYAQQMLDKNQITEDGMRKHWKIEAQYYEKDDTSNLASTGKKPSICVYRIVPYEFHSSKGAPVGTTPPGYEKRKKNAIKVYNYIYTGKNVDIINFDIQFNASWASVYSADGGMKSQDVQLNDRAGGTAQPDAHIAPMGEGGAATKPPPGSISPTAKYTGTDMSSDKKGGGGREGEGQRAARLLHDIITKGTDMIVLNMEIIGDPYFIAQSGQGNYRSKPTEKKGINKDGSVDYQSGEVDIVINFRTPIDINQSTGLYDFKGKGTAPVIAFSGLYQLINVDSSFRQGKFTQTLMGNRRMQQPEDTGGTGDKTKMYDVKKPSPVQPTDTDTVDPPPQSQAPAEASADNPTGTDATTTGSASGSSVPTSSSSNTFEWSNNVIDI